jgi:hypothetical protein
LFFVGLRTFSYAKHAGLKKVLKAHQAADLLSV